VWFIATESSTYWCVISLAILLTGIGDTRMPAGLVLATASAVLFAYPTLSAVWTAQHAPVLQSPHIQQELRTSPHGWRALLRTPEPLPEPIPITLSREPEIKAQIYPAARAPSGPTVIVLEGDDWTRKGEQPLPWASMLARHGYPALSVTLPDQEDLLSPEHPSLPVVIRWLKREGPKHGLSGESFYLLGQGAGGHAALQSAYRRRLTGLRGVLVWSTPTDLGMLWDGPAEPWLHGPQSELTRLLTGSPEEYPSHYEQGSPVQHVHPNAPRTLLGCGGRDLTVPASHCEVLEAALLEAGAEVESLIIPWSTSLSQSQPYGPSGVLWEQAMRQFLEER
jgi:acetyl esterase/lipase